ncbi:GAF and ANTAR domain-containing protein [Pseudonocardia humida]|uniref:GAF and ANTAR domain-containing protein n=1 Tax=Pseudonocardia humida TaxID=2800819 RepID=A0ABT0ZTK2_9PSEU|nr:GAF and ANTAR domain-containing protein [Pseudonocardia humida]MCO1654020.1 GAF and ANTAR domain-containing protein [Pseudonocardia humida]
MGGSEREQQLSRAFVALADTLVADYDVIALLDQLVGHCATLLDADAAGLLLADSRRELRVVAATSEDAELMELLQLQADEGPCLECYRTAAPVSVADLADTPTRWPVFCAAVEDVGAFRSVHALPLRLRGEAIGALNLFRAAPGPLPGADLALGQALADVATIGILQERAIRRGEVLTEQLQVALNSRVAIEQAKGVLAQLLDMGMDEAFDVLRRYARQANLRLADVARAVVSREVDGDALLAARRGRGPQPSEHGRRGR